MATGKVSSMEEFTVTLGENVTGTIVGRRSGRCVWIALIGVKYSAATGSGWQTIATVPSAHCPEQSYLYSVCWTSDGSTYRYHPIRVQSNTGLRVHNLTSAESVYGILFYMS